MGKLMLFVAMSWAACAADFEDIISVNVYNTAGARPAVIAEGERETSRIFKWAHIGVRWANCPLVDPGRGSNQVCVEPDDPHYFAIGIVGRFMMTRIKDTALGFAMPFSGERNHVAISYSSLTRVADEYPELVDYSRLLGAAMAHELAHLILASSHHGPGIMQARWERPELYRIGQKQFLFKSEQAAALRAGLRARNRTERWASVHAQTKPELNQGTRE